MRPESNFFMVVNKSWFGSKEGQRITSHAGIHNIKPEAETKIGSPDQAIREFENRSGLGKLSYRHWYRRSKKALRNRNQWSRPVDHRAVKWHGEL